MGLMNTRAMISLSVLWLAACAVGPNFKRPASPAASDYGSASTPAQTTGNEGPDGAAQRFVADLAIPGQWWTLFQSAALSGLVNDGFKANPDIHAAEAALRQAHELYLAQRGSLLPSIQGGASATRSSLPTATLTPVTVSSAQIYSLYTAQLSLSYVVDVFGGIRRSVEAAKAQEEISHFQLEAAYVSLSTNIVLTAVQEASLRGQITATERLLALQHQITETVRGQRALGTASELDLLTQLASEAQTASTLPPLQKQLGQTRDALTALLGRLPSEEPAEQFQLQDLTLPTDLPVSVPSKLVNQRPDVRAAEENLHAASAQVGVALANMLPQFTLTADTGSTALTLGHLFSPYTGFWDLGASLSQTLFQGGALVHRHRAADAALDQAADQYRSTVITACQNVADTLKALRTDADALNADEASDQATKATLDLAQRQVGLGSISLVALLNAEQSWQQAEINLIQARANRYADTVALFQALGGGWWNLKGETSDGQSGPAN
jgi:NodT family efflux transporter outer membrane factor (OMF) lipoprotein